MTRCYGLFLPLQQLAHVRPAVRARNRIDTPLVNPTYRHNRDYRSTNLDRPQLPATTVQLYSTTQPTSAYQHQTSNCISMTRPTPATLVDRPAANIYNAIIPATNIAHLAEDHLQPPRTFTYTLVNTTNKLSRYNCYFAFVPSLCFGCSHSHV